MKCEICHEADAAAVIHVKKDGEDKELFVCKSCAARARHTPEKTTRFASLILLLQQTQAVA